MGYLIAFLAGFVISFFITYHLVNKWNSEYEDDSYFDDELPYD